MINNFIGKEVKSEEKKDIDTSKKPNENNGVYISSHLKIFDPNTKEVLLQKRADD